MAADRGASSPGNRAAEFAHQNGLLLGTGIGRHHPGPTRRDLYVSLAFHTAILLSLALTGILNSRDMPEFQTFRVRLYSPPAQVQGPPAPAPVVTQNIVQTPTITTAVETPRPEPAIERPEQTRVAETRQEDPAPVAGDRPDPNSPGGENINVNLAGQDFPFPEYLGNIVLQMGRFIRWSGESDPEAVVTFYIERDGSVGGLKVVEKSTEWRFDLQALDAVTQAGRAGAFGPLPDGWVQDRLYVRFRFIPPGR